MSAARPDLVALLDGAWAGRAPGAADAARAEAWRMAATPLRLEPPPRPRRSWASWLFGHGPPPDAPAAGDIDFWGAPLPHPAAGPAGRLRRGLAVRGAGAAAHLVAGCTPPPLAGDRAVRLGIWAAAGPAAGIPLWEGALPRLPHRLGLAGGGPGGLWRLAVGAADGSVVQYLLAGAAPPAEAAASGP